MGTALGNWQHIVMAGLALQVCCVHKVLHILGTQLVHHREAVRTVIYSKINKKR